MNKKLDILVFAAHPDDAELSCGGTISRFVSLGKKTGIADLTLGELGTRGSAAIRQAETRKASEVLGISARLNLKMEDGNIQNTTQNRLKVIKVIRSFRPEIIFLPYPNDRHPDHIHASILIKESAFYSGLSKLKTVLNGKAQQSHRPLRLVYYMQTYTFEPSFIIDITNDFDTKMKAVKCYSSQFYNKYSREPETFISDKKFMEFLEARAKVYGFMAGVKYGEPFYTEEKLNLDPIILF
jgi:bacillithiol biosynthesis deacetylase BshB1